MRLAYTERNIQLIMEHFQCDELTARDALLDREGYRNQVEEMTARLGNAFNEAIELVLKELVLRGVFLGDIRIKKEDGARAEVPFKRVIEVLNRPYAEVRMEFKDKVYGVITERYK